MSLLASISEAAEAQEALTKLERQDSNLSIKGALAEPNAKAASTPKQTRCWPKSSPVVLTASC
jgi:hypothetical protein